MTSPRFSEIIKDQLYSGPHPLPEEWSELKGDLHVDCLISIVPIAQAGIFQADSSRFTPRPLVHKVLFAWDDTLLDPQQIHRYVASDTDLCTYIHCNAGENRSTILAACYVAHKSYLSLLLTHTADCPPLKLCSWWVYLAKVKKARQKTLNRPPKTHAATAEANIRRYVEWLEKRQYMY